MKTKTPFQFKLLRYYHDTFTGEFLNVGLACYAQDVRWFRVRLLHKYQRLTNTFPTADGEHYRRYITSLQTKFDYLAARVNSEQLALEPWLPDMIDGLLQKVLPPDDSSLQFGPPQGGMTDDLDLMFNDLYYRLVEKYVPSEERLSRTEQEIWQPFSVELRNQNVISHLRPTVIETPQLDVELDHAWRNGRLKAIQPLSFDLLHPVSISRKATTWFGTSVILDSHNDVAKIYFLLGKPRRDSAALRKAYDKGKDLLGSSKYSGKIQIIEEHEADDFARMISAQIRIDSEHTS